MSTVFNELIEEWDEIVSIEPMGFEDTLDINVTGNRLFYANNILTHNCAVEEVEFDHSHISGGISKIQTADNVFGIFTSRAMRERGRYQLQFMKTRSSSGVGQKIDLDFNIESLRITDVPEVEQEAGGVRIVNSTESMLDQIKRKTSLENANAVPVSYKKVNAEVGSTKLRSMLNGIGSGEEDEY